ncbi:MAG TPA: VOC family protein [Candidatus Thermoplasmatota archaeon]|nr:VOC family protein [Candidatus Thermoplasmatota archaeon]
MGRARISPVLRVGSVEKSLEFYRALGFRTGVAHLGTRQFACVEMPEARFLLEPRAAGDPSIGGTFHVATQDPAALWRAAQKMGAGVEEDGGLFRIEDPDGNTLLVSRERRRARPRPRRAVKRKRRRR